MTGVGVTGAWVGDGAGVGVARQPQETRTEFTGPVKVIVSLAGQVMVEGTAMVTERCSLGGSDPPAGFTVTPGIPLLLADQVRLRLGLSLVTVTVHRPHPVRFEGETASAAPGGAKRAGTASAALALETNGEHMTSALKMMSAQSARRLG
jgi:hypothetical protein